MAEIFRVVASKTLREWIPEWARGIKLGDAGRKRNGPTKRRGSSGFSSQAPGEEVGARGRARILLWWFHRRESSFGEKVAFKNLQIIQFCNIQKPQNEKKAENSSRSKLLSIKMQEVLKV